MGIMKKAFAPLAAFAALEAPQHIEASSVSKIAYASVSPVDAVSDADMKMRLFVFDAKLENMGRDKGVTVSEGLYDEVLGVACSWSIQKMSLAKYPDASIQIMQSHECRKMKQPKAWQKKIPPPFEKSLNKITSGVYSPTANVRDIVQVMMVSSGNPRETNYLVRQWDSTRLEVCLRMGTFDTYPVIRPTPEAVGILMLLNQIPKSGPKAIMIADNGCYKLGKAEFFVKRGQALGFGTGPV
ncbi:MAG: hypothetical protein DI551_08660 [Micavibrio aeruginosavorus]|uniref:Uncharacterized protein n=1 Tax=Micavibrio aeruginosavorus TaxID=349221 RepID=A0A2W5MV36_9BACT|nr:MAG: hypothetical protein DI551_08660 [Micavibrio aeruginosavorus]